MTDMDDDKIVDADDNCPAVANPDQENLDFDQHGDVCDDDIDGDGQDNETEEDCKSDPYDAESMCQD
jgi:hypothetical protein